MPYTLSGQPLSPSRGFTIGETNYTGAELIHWPREDLLALPGMEWIEPEPPTLTAEDICRQIDAERDRRIDGGFVFRGERFQSRPSDRENVMGAAQLAMGYLAAGGDPLSLRWADPDNDFVWITADNGTIPLTAADKIAMFQAGVAFKSALTFYARAMKDAVIAAEDPSSVEWREGWPE